MELRPDVILIVITCIWAGICIYWVIQWALDKWNDL